MNEDDIKIKEIEYPHCGKAIDIYIDQEKLKELTNENQS